MGHFRRFVEQNDRKWPRPAGVWTPTNGLPIGPSLKVKPNLTKTPSEGDRPNGLRNGVLEHPNWASQTRLLKIPTRSTHQTSSHTDSRQLAARCACLCGLSAGYSLCQWAVWPSETFPQGVLLCQCSSRPHRGARDAPPWYRCLPGHHI